MEFGVFELSSIAFLYPEVILHCANHGEALLLRDPGSPRNPGSLLQLELALRMIFATYH